jgi:murein L,D-transpeptidase YcbB/YkuD
MKVQTCGVIHLGMSGDYCSVMKFDLVRSLVLATTMATLPGLALAQAAQQPAPKPVAAPPQQSAPATARDPMAPLPPAEGTEPAIEDLPPPIWQMSDTQDLLVYILGIGNEGLNPADYDPAGLNQAIRSGDPMAMSKLATDLFNRVSSDLAFGHVRGDDRQAWHVVDKDLDDVRQRQMLEAALATHRVPAVLQTLLPTHPQYASLKNALAMTDKADTAKLNRIRLNMDRWRWLPRELGNKYIIVNVPAFYATLVENGVTRWKHRAIAGATKTPTPQLSAMATGVMLNPWWEVPTSISKEVAGKPGYVVVKGKDGKVQRWRQPPGPTNALGQLKFVMYNPHNIYLHDTNARSRFAGRMRALSHGCIRTEHVLDLATELLGDDGGEWTPDRIQAALESKKTIEAKFVKPVPVYIVYFSVAALNDGTIQDYQDLYNRDPKVLAALLDNKPAPKATQTAAK